MHAQIDVGYNDINEAASLELIAAMKGKSMMSIGMARCDLRLEGAKAVAELVSVNPSLTSINLRSNELGAAGAAALAPGLAANGSLTKIDVSWNCLGDEGEAALSKAVEGRSDFELVL